MAHYWLINTAATAVPLSAHPSPLVITTKLAAAILGGGLFGGGVLPTQYCPCGMDRWKMDAETENTRLCHLLRYVMLYTVYKTVATGNRKNWIGLSKV